MLWQATRSLQTRLALAGFKASRGWSSIKLDVIEPHLAQQAQDRKRKASEDLHHQSATGAKAAGKRRAPSIANVQNASPAASGPTGNLFNAMLAGNVPPSSVQSPSSLARGGTTPATAAGRNASVFPSGSGRGFQPPPGRPIKPLSTSDPAFARSATEYVDAANVLNSLSRAPSDAAILAGAGSPIPIPRSPISHTRRTAGLPEASTPGRGGAGTTERRSASQEEEEQEDAAELMLFLAASPSPQAKRTASVEVSAAQGGGPMGVQGRKLFADDGPIEQQRQANQPTSQTSSFTDLSAGGFPTSTNTSSSAVGGRAASSSSSAHLSSTTPINFAGPGSAPLDIGKGHPPSSRIASGSGVGRSGLSGSFDPSEFLSLSPGLGSFASTAGTAGDGLTSMAAMAGPSHAFGGGW